MICIKGVSIVQSKGKMMFVRREGKGVFASANEKLNKAQKFLKETEGALERLEFALILTIKLMRLF